MMFAKKGDIITTEKTNLPVYEFLEDVKSGEIMKSSSVKSVCDLPNPRNGDVVIGKYMDDRFIRYSEYGCFEFHFKDGWR